MALEIILIIYRGVYTIFYCETSSSFVVVYLFSYSCCHFQHILFVRFIHVRSCSGVRSLITIVCQCVHIIVASLSLLVCVLLFNNLNNLLCIVLHWLLSNSFAISSDEYGWDHILRRSSSMYVYSDAIDLKVKFLCHILSVAAAYCMEDFDSLQ